MTRWRSSSPSRLLLRRDVKGPGRFTAARAFFLLQTMTRRHVGKCAHRLLHRAGAGVPSYWCSLSTSPTGWVGGHHTSKQAATGGDCLGGTGRGLLVSVAGGLRTTHSIMDKRTVEWGRTAPDFHETQGYAEGQTPARGGAAWSDRRLREAWGGPVGSAYLSCVRLPRRVAAGDVGEARAILGRIVACLEREGSWTKLERRRLLGLAAVWGRRASGSDLQFNMYGWRHPKHYGPRINTERGLHAEIDTFKRDMEEMLK